VIGGAASTQFCVHLLREQGVGSSNLPAPTKKSTCPCVTSGVKMLEDQQFEIT
jgi:hypothetical protein